MNVFGFSSVARHSLSSSLGLLGVTGNHAVMLGDLTRTAFWEVGLEPQAHVAGHGLLRRRVNPSPVDPAAN